MSAYALSIYRIHTLINNIGLFTLGIQLITIHTPLLFLPSRFRTPTFFIKERSRSTVRVVTDKVSDICLAEIVGDSFIKLIIFC